MDTQKIFEEIKRSYNISDTCQALKNLQNAMRVMAETLEKF